MIRPVAALHDPQGPLTASSGADDVPRTKQGGVGLTGPERPYVERRDNSGWSGRSTPPEALGGGPPASGAASGEEGDSAAPREPENAATPPPAKESLSPAP